MDDRYKRYSPQSDYYGRQDPQDYTRDYGSGRDYTYSSARDFSAVDNRYDDRGRGRDSYGSRDAGNRDYGYGNRDYGYGSRDYYGGREYGNDRNYDRDVSRGYRNARLGESERYGGTRERDYGDNRPRGEWNRDRDRNRSRGDYDYEDRGFFARAGDEVASWFGSEEAERRREMDERYDRQHSRGRHDSDPHYMQWRRQRIAELDRDYDEYRRENSERFHNEFNSFRTERQTQRASLNRVEEHMEVLGSDGEHVGTVDKVRGDRILLTKSDKDAGGHHHSIPSRWIESVESNKVKLRKTAEEAQNRWRDEERNMAFFRDDDDEVSGERNLNRSFSGTY